jgi:hypothetical protein
MILPTAFQPRKDGDMACVRGPLGAFVVAIYRKLGDKEGLLLVQQRSLFVVAEHRRKGLIIAIKGHVEASL